MYIHSLIIIHTKRVWIDVLETNESWTLTIHYNIKSLSRIKYTLIVFIISLITGLVGMCSILDF